MSTKAKVEQILRAAGIPNARVSVTSDGERNIVATVESDSFAGMSDSEQQDCVWSALRGGLTEEELTRVEFVFTRAA